jgi:pimeloyl-ACP methyl ester carboxylesterase
MPRAVGRSLGVKKRRGWSRRIHVPVLSVGPRGDPCTSFGDDTRAWDRRIPDVRALMLPGSDHGVDLLHDRHRPRVQAAIARFIRSL